MKYFRLQSNTFEPITNPKYSNKLSLRASREEGLELLSKLDVKQYAMTRNSLSGGVSKLSIYVEHGLLDIVDFLEHIDSQNCQTEAQALLKQLYWREFFLQTYKQDPKMIWEDYEPYKTGYSADEYTDEFPVDIQNAKTQIPLIDILVTELNTTGYLHNHARLYLASYIVHFRRIRWQSGALWMLKLLNDGNLAVNNLSWQWVASTRSNKPYIFNWDNIEQFAAARYGLERQDHTLFDASYEDLHKRLFKESL